MIAPGVARRPQGRARGSPPVRTTGTATMQRFATVLAALALTVSSAPGDEAGLDGRHPDLPGLMDSVVAQLPHEPLTISGEISVTRRRGVEVRSLRFETRLELGAEPPTARYTIRDAFGRNLSQLTCRWQGSDVSYAFVEGDPLSPAPVPNLGESIHGSDVSWFDLTLSFLWWRDGRVTGDDVVKGRSCWVAEVAAPAGHARGKVRVWVDKQVPMLLQAESLDEKGRRSRLLCVKSLKKIKGRWMVREMEVQQEPKEHMTHILITGLNGELLATPDGGDAVNPVRVASEPGKP
jgi:hypothetical protein